MKLVVAEGPLPRRSRYELRASGCGPFSATGNTPRGFRFFGRRYRKWFLGALKKPDDPRFLKTGGTQVPESALNTPA